MNKRNSHSTALTTLQARTILSIIAAYIGALCDRDSINKAAAYAVEKVETAFAHYYPIDNHFGYMAFALANCAREGIKRGELTVLEYIKMLADIKSDNETLRNDYGAFGDLFEILIRCAFMGRLALVNWATLTVKQVNQSDIVSKKYGTIEVGHNGKTLTNATLFDFMEGPYTSVVYGVFDKTDKKNVYDLCRRGEYEKALDYVTSYSVYWADKYDFQRDMNDLTRGKGITAKGDGVQVVFNDGKCNAFIDAIESGKFTSLFELLNR